MRTDEEIESRAVLAMDFLNQEKTDLLVRLSPDRAWAVAGNGADKPAVFDWPIQPRDRESVIKEIVEYLPFARGKADDERGISANRSICHFRAWVWLLGDADFSAIDWSNYGSYGRPILDQLEEKYATKREGNK